jgi:hypothetical protein
LPGKATMSANDELKPDPAAPAPTASVPESATVAPAKRHIPRRIATWVLVVLFAILTPLTLTAGWALKTVTNTDRYVATMQPIADDPVVQHYVATKATTTLFEQVHVQQRIEKAIPFGGFIAAPLTAQLEQFTNEQLFKLVSSKWFSNLWARENRFTQQQALAVLTGKPMPPATAARQVVVDLTPTLTKAIDDLDKKGITVFNPIRDHLQSTRSLTLRLFNDKQVKQVQGFFRLAIDARTALLVLTPLVGILAIVVAVRRRRAAFRIAVAGVIGCLVLSVGLVLARKLFVDSVHTDGQLVAGTIFDIFLRYLNGTLHWAIALFAIAAVILWVVGDTDWAIATRRAFVGGSKQLGSAVDQARKSETAGKAVAWTIEAGRYVGNHAVPFRWGGIIVGAIFVLISHTTGGVFWTLLILIAYEVGVFFLERWATRSMDSTEPPASEPAEVTSSK